MDKEAVKFFESKGYRMTDLLDPRRQPTMFKEAQVKAGAEVYYKKIKSGEIKAKVSTYAAGIWEEAKRVKYDQFLKDNEILEHHKKIIEALNITIRKWKRSTVVLGLLLIFVALYGIIGDLCGLHN